MAGFFDAVRSMLGGDAKIEIPPGQGEVVIDVRSGMEFAMGHHPGAVHIPVQEIAGRIEALLPDKSRPIVLYCASGGRAGAAAGVLKKLGYRRVENAGGLADMARRKQEVRNIVEAVTPDRHTEFLPGHRTRLR